MLALLVLMTLVCAAAAATAMSFAVRRGAAQVARAVVGIGGAAVALVLTLWSGSAAFTCGLQTTGELRLSLDYCNPVGAYVFGPDVVMSFVGARW